MMITGPFACKEKYLGSGKERPGREEAKREGHVLASCHDVVALRNIGGILPRRVAVRTGTDPGHYFLGAPGAVQERAKCHSTCLRTWFTASAFAISAHSRVKVACALADAGPLLDGQDLRRAMNERVQIWKRHSTKPLNIFGKPKSIILPRIRFVNRGRSKCHVQVRAKKKKHPQGPGGRRGQVKLYTTGRHASETGDRGHAAPR
jgi:hypothetical protein